MRRAFSLAWAAGVSLACVAETNGVSGLTFDAGADLRVRQEIMHNVPGLPGGQGAMMPSVRKEAVNHIRYRPRVWARADSESFGFYVRVADEMREHIVKHGQRRDDRAYNFPDEVVLDNLYLEGRGLYDDFLDFRLGRQDLFDGKHSVLGLDRLMLDGAPYVGSRSCYADMARVTLHPAEDRTLDLFTLYDNGRNTFSWGNDNSRGRPMNAIHPGDGPQMDEWGGGAVWNDDFFEKRLPYQLYVVHKHNEAYRNYAGTRVEDKQITAVGLHLMPRITEELSLDFDGAQQFGTRSNDAQAGGTMGYAAVDWHPKTAAAWQPYVRPSVYFLSGDRHRTGADDNDTAWDPMWARAPCDSELMQYGTLYGLGYWSNLLYAKLTLGASFGPHHGVSVYSGPMWADEQDGLGHSADDPSGVSRFKGVLSAARYDFPIVLAPKGAQGWDRFSIFGHVIGEVFNPGDYYESGKPAYFIRWEFNFRF